MKDDPEMEMNDARSDEDDSSPRRSRMRPDESRSRGILLAMLLVLVFAGGVFYFLSRNSTGGEAASLQSKVTALDQKVSGLEKQLAALQGRSSVPGTDPALLQRVDALAQKVEALERQKQATAEPRANPSASSKTVVSTEKQYHTVQKGETLHRISKRFGISVKELRKLNNLSADQPLRTGQKLLVSRGH